MNPDQYLIDANKRSQVLYYPGSGADSGPFRLFAESGRVSAVVYVDYGIEESEARKFISEIDGWRPGKIKNLQPCDFQVPSWDSFWPESPRSRNFYAPDKAFAIKTTLSSASTTVEFTFLGTEAIQTFSVLIGANIIPTAMVLQDHGFGGNGSAFGGHSEMFHSAVDHNALPELLYVAKNTGEWPGYRKVSDYSVYGGQMHNHERAIFQHPNSGKAPKGSWIND